MAVTVRIPTPLRQYTANQREVHIDGRTVSEVLSKLVASHGQLKQHFFDERGELRGFVNVYVNNEDIRHGKGVETPVKAGDTVVIVPAVAGGALPMRGGPPPMRDPRALSREEIRRYSRHLILPEFGMGAQQKLKGSSALVIGAGGLGSPVSLYLAAAGVGRIGIVDFDTIDESNLQRQVLFTTADVGKSKARVAKERLQALNPNVAVDAIEKKLDSTNALDVFRDYDVILDGTDNFPTRYLTNDACVLLHKPNVYGSIFRFEGQASVFWADRGPCYRCLYAKPPPPGLVPSCAEGGVLGILPGLVGSIQATEAIKILTGTGEPLVGRLLLYDALGMSWTELKLRKNPNCPVCGPNPTVTELIDYYEFCGVRGVEDDQGPALERGLTIEAEELKAKLDRREPVFVLDVREPTEFEIARIQGSTLIPLGQLPARVNELSTADEIVVHCHVGGRSARAVEFLREMGFRKVKNLTGGIKAWSDRVDPDVPQY